MIDLVRQLPKDENLADFNLDFCEQAESKYLKWQQNQDKQVDEKFLLHLIDVTWNHCTESKEVPSTDWAKRIILEAQKQDETD